LHGGTCLIDDALENKGMTPENGHPPFNPVETPSLRMHQRVQELLDRMCTGDQADLSKHMPALQQLIIPLISRCWLNPFKS